MMSKKKQPQKKSNRTIIYAGLAVLAIVALVAYLSANSPANPEARPLDVQPSAPGKVKLVEFLKFDCIHCYNLHKELPKILEKYGDKLEVVYIPIAFPGQSTKSIEAYVIAEEMGKGKEMQDALFQAKFEKGMDIMESKIALEDVAASIGLGADFNSKLEGGYAKQTATAYLGYASKYEVSGTPTVLINGKQVNPPAGTDNWGISIDSSISSLLNQ